MSSFSRITLPTTVTKKDDDNRIRKITVGSKNPLAWSPGKVLMLLGETGSGKSTFVNRLVNYLMGIKHDDEDRYKLIDEPERESAETAAHSQTKWITAYTFNQENYPKLPYTFTIIDTPGYNDTEGLERGEAITKQIKEFFSLKGSEGIDHLEGVGLVVQAGTSKITKTQIYIYDSILSIFGKDFVDSVFLIITNSDGSKHPAVLDVIDCAKISHQEYFLFNNQLQGPPILHKIFWEMAEERFDQFFAAFNLTKSVSLVLAKKVLQERDALSEAILNIQKKIKLGVNKIEQLKVEEKTLESLKEGIEDSKRHTYTVTVMKKREIKLKEGYFVTNCKKCKVTCHYPCIVGNGEKSICSVIKKNGHCSHCSKDLCHWSKHENSKVRFEFYEASETRTIEDLKKRYEKGLSGKDEKEKIIKCLNEEIAKNTKAVVLFIHEVGSAIKRLNEIALNPIPLSEEDYIDILIDDEKRKAKTGFLERINSLEMVKEKVRILKNLDSEEKRDAHLQNLQEASTECLAGYLLDLKA